MNKKTVGIIAGVVVLVGGFAIYQRSQASGKKADSTEKKEVRTIRVAHTQNYVPYDYVNEAGKSDGFEVQVLKAVDKKLKDYKFEYTPTSDEDLLIGIESGKYDIGTKGAWKTAEREKKFIIPEEKIGASIIGITFRTADKDKFTDFDAFAENSGKLVPISPQNAQYQVVEDYNKKNPDHKIDLKAAEQFNASDAYAWVLEKRYDAYFDIKLSYETSIVKEDGPYHKWANELSYLPYKGIPTYPLIHKSEENKEFAKAYDKAIKELESDGVFDELSEKYFGENVFKFVD
ncbi:MAG: transporter substrate-binding domain-containing protein [Lactobacillales bacterium]|nr:transporter substrate-binding domain-containing protein [Lactobacillales bacterium]